MDSIFPVSDYLPTAPNRARSKNSTTVLTELVSYRNQVIGNHKYNAYGTKLVQELNGIDLELSFHTLSKCKQLLIQVNAVEYDQKYLLVAMQCFESMMTMMCLIG